MLGIIAHGRDLRLQMLFALTTDHPEYKTSKPDEQHCYREGYLTITRPTVVEWRAGTPMLSTDADGTFDFGGIELYRSGETRFRIVTAWFDAAVETASVAVNLLSE